MGPSPDAGSSWANPGAPRRLRGRRAWGPPAWRGRAVVGNGVPRFPRGTPAATCRYRCSPPGLHRWAGAGRAAGWQRPSGDSEGWYGWRVGQKLRGPELRSTGAAGGVAGPRGRGGGVASGRRGGGAAGAGRRDAPDANPGSGVRCWGAGQAAGGLAVGTCCSSRSRNPSARRRRQSTESAKVSETARARAREEPPRARAPRAPPGEEGRTGPAEGAGAGSRGRGGARPPGTATEHLPSGMRPSARGRGSRRPRPPPRRARGGGRPGVAPARPGLRRPTWSGKAGAHTATTCRGRVAAGLFWGPAATRPAAPPAPGKSQKRRLGPPSGSNS